MSSWLFLHGRELAADALFVGGIASVTVGAWMIYPPAAWIVGGIGTGALGVLLARG